MFRAAGAIVLATLALSGCARQGAEGEQRSKWDVADKTLKPLDIAKMQVDLFVRALNRYKLSLGSFPTTQQGLQALRTPPPDLPKDKKWDGPYFNPEISAKPIDPELPLDPWRHPYHYRFPGTHNPDTFDVWSLGPDGVDGTPDDIGNWK